jgi:hypothetical protein
VQALRDFLTAREEIAEVFNLITIQLGVEIMVAVKTRMTEADSVSKLIADINQIERDLKVAFPSVRWIFFEPDNIV